MPHSHPDHKDKHSDDSLFKGLVMGAVIGAGILWLLGTEEGKRIKKQLLKEGEDLLNRGKNSEDLSSVALSEVEGAEEDEVEEELPRVVKSALARRTIRKAVKPLKKPATAKRFFRKRR